MTSLRNQLFQTLSICPTWSHLESWYPTQHQQGLGWRARLPLTKRPQGWANSGWNCLATNCRLQGPQKILTRSYAFLRVFLVFLAGFLVFLRILARPFFAEVHKFMVRDPQWDQRIDFAIVAQWEHTTAYLQVNFLHFSLPLKALNSYNGKLQSMCFIFVQKSRGCSEGVAGNHSGSSKPWNKRWKYWSGHPMDRL